MADKIKPEPAKQPDPKPAKGKTVQTESLAEVEKLVADGATLVDAKLIHRRGRKLYTLKLEG
jgi:hypothetical protein